MSSKFMVQHTAAILCASLAAAACGGRASEARAVGEDETTPASGSTDHGAPSPAQPGTEELEGADHGTDNQQADPTTDEPNATDGSLAEPTSSGGGQPELPEQLPAPLPLELDGDPLFSSFIRLTHVQWEASVGDLLHVPSAGLGNDLRPDPYATDFSNDERVLYVGADLYFDYEAAVHALVSQLDAASLNAIYDGDDAVEFIAVFGRRAYRRPLTDEEQARYLQLFDLGSSLNTSQPFVAGAGLVIEAMLQSPYFIYRAELSPTGLLNGYEVATRLSYFVLGTTPSDELLDLAEDGELDSADGIAEVAAGLLQSEGLAERVLASVRRYHVESLRAKRFAQAQQNSPEVDALGPDVRADLFTASTLFFDDIYTEGMGVRELFLSTVGYANDSLAPLYGLQPGSTDFERIDFGPERPGFLTQVPFLLYHGAGETPLTSNRGSFITSSILCAFPPEPPGAIPPLLPPQDGGETNRERVEAATGKGTCGETCHVSYLDPLGFAFENFDGLGRLRQLDNGKPVDTSAAYPFTEGYLTFSGAPELMQLIAESEQAHGCYASRLLQYALGRELTEVDRELVDDLTEHSLNGLSVRDLIEEVVRSETFRSTADLRGGD